MASARRSNRRPAARRNARHGGGRRSGSRNKPWARKLRRALGLLGSGWSMVTAGAAVGIVVVFVMAERTPGPAPQTRAVVTEIPPQVAAPQSNLPVGSPASAQASAPVAASASPPAVSPAPNAPTLAALPAPPPSVEGGTPAWLRNAVATPETGSRPVIAVVIDDLGLNRVNTARVSDLPGPLTMAFLTYAGDLRRQTAAARRAGHELIVHMAMEPMGEHVDPGPDVLRIADPPGQLIAQLRRNLDAFDGYVGINNHMGSRFTASEPDMRLVLAELKARGLLFLDSRTTAESVGGKVASQLGVPFAARDVFIDNVQSADAVEAKLAEGERIARAHGHAVVIGHPHDATIAALAAWLPTLESRGFALVPISTIVKRGLGAGG